VSPVQALKRPLIAGTREGGVDGVARDGLLLGSAVQGGFSGSGWLHHMD